jgi:hypothetical protein
MTITHDLVFESEEWNEEDDDNEDDNNYELADEFEDYIGVGGEAIIQL